MLTGGGQVAVAETEAFQAAPSKFANDLLFELPPHAAATTDEIARSVRFICAPPKMVPRRFQRTTSHYLGTLLHVDESEAVLLWLVLLGRLARLRRLDRLLSGTGPAARAEMRSPKAKDARASFDEALDRSCTSTSRRRL